MGFARTKMRPARDLSPRLAAGPGQGSRALAWRAICCARGRARRRAIRRHQERGAAPDPPRSGAELRPGRPADGYPADRRQPARAAHGRPERIRPATTAVHPRRRLGVHRRDTGGRPGALVRRAAHRADHVFPGLGRVRQPDPGRAHGRRTRAPGPAHGPLDARRVDWRGDRAAAGGGRAGRRRDLAADVRRSLRQCCRRGSPGAIAVRRPPRPTPETRPWPQRPAAQSSQRRGLAHPTTTRRDHAARTRERHARDELAGPAGDPPSRSHAAPVPCAGSPFSRSRTCCWTC